ncbi:hypothetical protein CYMTET_35309 [Cymbomonas tetramitiformis]|uniref:Uncharacterized protein n=1 Tax=Cymbomonas tetramitiformis TaxID=36881 RepID=A0AAE0KP11_9CHLO|nr:hypothetical protein CYMTET_35309 [Cymbomonas tetramitiformis]
MAKSFEPERFHRLRPKAHNPVARINGDHRMGCGSWKVGNRFLTSLDVEMSLREADKYKWPVQPFAARSLYMGAKADDEPVHPKVNLLASSLRVENKKADAASQGLDDVLSNLHLPSPAKQLTRLKEPKVGPCPKLSVNSKALAVLPDSIDLTFFPENPHVLKNLPLLQQSLVESPNNRQTRKLLAQAVIQGIEEDVTEEIAEPRVLEDSLALATHASLPVCLPSRREQSAELREGELAYMYGRPVSGRTKPIQKAHHHHITPYRKIHNPNTKLNEPGHECHHKSTLTNLCSRQMKKEDADSGLQLIRAADRELHETQMKAQKIQRQKEEHKRVLRAETKTVKYNAMKSHLDRAQELEESLSAHKEYGNTVQYKERVPNLRLALDAK